MSDEHKEKQNNETGEEKKGGSLTDKAGIIVFSRIITTIIELVMVIVLINLTQKQEFAIISFLLIVYETARYVATMGFPDSVFYFFERLAKTAKKAFALQTCGILSVTGMVSFFIIIGLSYIPEVYLREWDPEAVMTVGALLPYMAFVAILEIPTWPVQNLMLAADRQKDSAWFQLGNSVMTFTALVVPLWLGFELETALQCLVLYSGIRFVIALLWVWKMLPAGPLMPDRGLLREQIRFSIPIGLSMLTSRFNRYIDKFVVSAMLPAAAFAEYTVGAQEVPVIRVIPFAVGTVLISRFVSLQLESKKEELLSLWYRGIEKVSLLVIPLTILFITIAEDFILALVGDEYLGAVLPFQIYTLIVLMRVTHYGSILQAFGDTKGILYLSLNLLAANLILSIPFTYFFGIAGTAASTFIANMYNWHITLRRIGGHMELPARKVLPFPFYLRVLGVSVVVAAITYGIRTAIFAMETPLVNILWMAPFFLLLFALLGTLTGTIRNEDWRQFIHWSKLKFFYQ